MRDYYLILGVGRHADKNKIKQAFRKIAKKRHPDQCGADDSKERFIELRNAYETLVDEKKREEYDRELQAEERPKSRRLEPGRPVKPHSRRVQPDAGPAFRDGLFEDVASGFFHGEMRSSNDNFFFELILSPSEARDGVDAPIVLPAMARCPECRSAGFPNAWFCPLCSGQGWIETGRKFYITIPPNVRHGSRFRASLSGLGVGRSFLDIRVIIDPFTNAES